MTQATSAPGWPVLRGIQTVKEVSYLNMRQASAAAALSKLWSDTFLTNAGIYAAGSANYVYQGTPNFNVVKTSTAPDTVPTMSGATTPSGVASADTEDGTAYAWKAFNKNQSAGNVWTSTSAALPHWCQYDFGAGITKRITNYTIWGGGTSLNEDPKDFKLQGSNNGSTWTDVDTRTGQASAGDYQPRSFTCNGTVGDYRYYRLYVTANTSTNYVSLGEFSLYEAAPTTASVVSVLALDLAADVTQAMMFADVTLGTGTAAYYVSTDDGSTWTAVTPETLASVPAGKKIRIKVELTGDAELESWGVAV